MHKMRNEGREIKLPSTIYGLHQQPKLPTNNTCNHDESLEMVSQNTLPTDVVKNDNFTRPGEKNQFQHS